MRFGGVLLKTSCLGITSKRALPRIQLARDCQEVRRAETPLTRSTSGFKLGDIIMLKPELAEQISGAELWRQLPDSAGNQSAKSKASTWSCRVAACDYCGQKNEPVRFVGHLATMRVFERAFRRAGLPVGYTQGIHPRQKLAFGPPLTLGYTSQAEYLDLQLETPFQQEMISRLNRALPPGFHVSQGKPIFGKATSLSSLINLACYEVILPDPTIVTPSALDELLARESVTVSRRKGDQLTEVNIRNSVAKLELHLSGDSNILYMELAMGNLGFVKPEEILEQGLGLSEETALPLRVRRTELADSQQRETSDSL